MGLATAILALSTLPLADTFGSAETAVRLGSAIAVAFTLFHIVVLTRRARAMAITLAPANYWSAGAIDLTAIAVGIVGIALPAAPVYEWVLILLLARAMLGFVLVLGDAPKSG